MFSKKVRTAQNRLSAKFQALYVSGMYKNERLPMSLEILHSEMDLFHKMYQIMTQDSYVPFIIASLTGLRICHFPLYTDFQMPENTKKSDYHCETPTNWITGRLF